MRVLACFAACLVLTYAVQVEEKQFRELNSYIQTLPAEEQSEVIGGFVTNVVDSLVKDNDIRKLSEFYTALERASQTGVEKRDAADDAFEQNLKRGHCCLGGELVVSYATKTVTMPVVDSVHHNTNHGYTNCGTFGWRRCHTSTSISHLVVYTTKTVDLKVPRFTCHQDRAVCCHGYVEIKKLPGDLAQLGDGNCIESSQALFTIWNLQLLERIAEQKITVTTEQQDKIFAAAEKFFNTNGIRPA